VGPQEVLGSATVTVATGDIVTDPAISSSALLVVFFVGARVGALVGAVVGARVGAFVGAVVGSRVGAFVGAFVVAVVM
jgi:hypothetical protein